MTKSILPQTFLTQKLRLTQFSGFLELAIGDLLIICSSDEAYFGLVEALCSGQAVTLSVIVSSPAGNGKAPGS